MAREEDGRNEKLAFFSLALPSLTRRNSQLLLSPGQIMFGAFPAPASVTENAAVPRLRCPWVSSPSLSFPGPYGALCLPWVRRLLGSPICLTAPLALQQPGGQCALFTLLPTPLPHSAPRSALTGVGLLQVIVRRPLPPWVALWWFRSATYLLPRPEPWQEHVLPPHSTPLPSNAKTSPFPTLWKSFLGIFSSGQFGVQRCIVLNAIPVDKTITISSCCVHSLGPHAL